MTGVYETHQIILMLAGVFGAGAGITWAFMRALNQGRVELRKEILDAIADLKVEFKIEVARLWEHNEKIAAKWELRADKVHERLSDHGKAARDLSDKVLEISVLLAARVNGGSTRVPRARPRGGK